MKQLKIGGQVETVEDCPFCGGGLSGQKDFVGREWVSIGHKIDCFLNSQTIIPVLSLFTWNKRAERQK